jgi:hypothetical protein
MNAIKILGKAPNKSGTSIIDYEFIELISPILSVVDSHFWVLSNVVYRTEAKDGSTCLELSGEKRSMFLFDSRDFQIASPGFMEQYGKHIRGDWTSISAFHTKEGALSVEEIGKKEILKSEVTFVCVDAAYWVVYAVEPELLDRLKGSGFEIEEGNIDLMLKKSYL